MWRAEVPERTPREMCLGDSVRDMFYGRGTRYAAGWWGTCLECGQVCPVDFWDGREWAGWHTRPVSQTVQFDGA